MPAPFGSLATNPPIPTDLLLTHAAFLRALAKSLLGDEHAAEDVLQETWVHALEGPPASQERLGGWLRRVTERMALKHRRSAGRRTRREQAAAREEGLAAVDDALAEQEQLRRVVDCVLALEQRYRRVILMRYYQDLPPREIARRLDLSVATVDSQLHRARELLRHRLDDDAGGRHAWAGALATATGWNAQAAVAAAGASAGGMTMAWKIGLGAAVAASVWLGATNAGVLPPSAGSSGGAVQSAALRGAAGAAPVGPVAPGAQDGRGSERVAVDAPAPAAALPGAPVPAYSYALAGTVVDELDRPMPGARVLLAPLDQPLNDVGATDRDGAFRVTWRASSPQMAVALQVQGAGDGALQRFDLQAGRALDVRLATRSGLQEKMRAEEGLRVRVLQQQQVESGASADLAQREELDARVAQLGKVRAGGLFSPASRIAAEVVPGEGVRYSWPPARAAAPAVASRSAEGQRIDELRGKEVAGQLERRKRAPQGGFVSLESTERLRVVGTVLDAAGAPVNDAYVQGDDGHGRYLARTGQDGAFELQIPLTRTLQLHAGGGDLGLAHASFELPEQGAQRELHWNPVLDRGSEVLGRLVDRAGEHLDDWQVEVVLADGAALWMDASTSSDPLGAFAIPNVHGSAGQLLVRRSAATPFAHKIVSGVRPGEEQTIVVEPEELGTGSLRVQAVDAVGKVIEDVEARLWQPSSGRGARLERKDAALRLEDLPRGGYRLTLGSQSRGFVDCGAVWIEPGQETDLGAIALPAAGSVRISCASEPRPDQAGLGWRLQRADLPAPTVVAAGSVTSAFEAELPAGEYAVLVGGAELAAPPVRFTVQPGRPAVIELDPARLRAVTFALELPADVASDTTIAWTLVDAVTGAELVAHERTAGAFALLLPEGAYRAGARARELGATAELVVGAQAAEPVRLPLQ